MPRQLIAVMILIIVPLRVTAVEIWNGAPTAFNKADFADPILPENQDCITPTVCLTRGDNQGLYNAATEAGYSPNSSPAGTLWYFGSDTDDPGLIDRLSFSSWQEAHDSSPIDTIGINAVVYIVAEDTYLDITFTSWTEGGAGGGFGYQRATPSDDTDIPIPGYALLMMVVGIIASYRLSASGRAHR